MKEIKHSFLGYFKKNGHEVLPSSSLVPYNDPSLLFTNAGMVQFKDYFENKKTPPFSKVATSQKCLRAGGKHNDLENVGYTSRHHTFFEMLGNFAFFDYFKEEAIFYAWEVITKEFGLDPVKLCVTVFANDEEAISLWKKIANLPEEKIIKIASSDNFWSMGETGPCGPCSEIFYDNGEEIFGGPPGSPEQDGDRFIEIWNIVFMQYEKKTDGSQLPLFKPCIDTGMGLERIAAVLQGKTSNFQTNLFMSLKEKIHEYTIKEVKSLVVSFSENEQSYNVIADHIRAISFLIAEGILPSNEGRGYVLRRIIRRASRHAKLIGHEEPLLFKLVDILVNLMGKEYEELKQHSSLIQKVILEEELRFKETLSLGLKLLENFVESSTNNTLPGSVAFKLYDTYGFPLDLTEDILKAYNIKIDHEEFERLMKNQKDMSKKAELGVKVFSNETDNWALKLNQAKVPFTKKLCFSQMSIENAEVLYFQESTEMANNDEKKRNMFLVLDMTPFFTESGGQVCDTGFIKYNNLELIVTNAIWVQNNTDDGSKNNNGWVVHECEIFENKNFLESLPNKGDFVTASLNITQAKQISAHHSATHILQAALRKILGNHVTQKGSLVDANRLRFDFTHTKELSSTEKQDVEELVNKIIVSATPTNIFECSKEEALKLGALALFDEKYADKVRLVQIGKIEEDNEISNYFSQELCGGRHVVNTGEIGGFHILSETGISSGVRRIEAACGTALLSWWKKEQEKNLQEIIELKGKNKALQKEIQKLKENFATTRIEFENKRCGEVNVAMSVANIAEPAQLFKFAKNKVAKMEEDVFIISTTNNEKISIIIGVSSKCIDKIRADELIKIACESIQGNGGGNAKLAQCSSSNTKLLNYAINQIENFLNKK